MRPFRIVILGLIPLVSFQAKALGQPLNRVAEGWQGLQSYWNIVILGGFTVGNLALSFAIILLTFVFRYIFGKVVFAGLKALAARTAAKYDDRFLEALERPASWFILFAGIFLAVRVLPLQAELQNIISILFRGLSMVIVFWAILRLFDVLGDALEEITGKGDSGVSALIPVIKKATRVFVIVVGMVMVIDNLGYSVGGIIAALGIGGAAFAFAAKDTIANLYGSFALALDRPFNVGDWVTIGDDVDGNIEEIGLRSTKVRTWPKTVLSIPNSILANKIINNWTRMPKRRVKQIVGVSYETSPDDVGALVEDIREILRRDEGVNQEFILVNFVDFGESSLNILVYYFTNTIAWLEHMKIRQRINLRIIRAVEARGSSIAFPTRTVYFEGAVAKGMGGSSAFEGLPADHGPTTPP